MSAAICDFRGCVFPAIWTYRDINADVPVCQQHAQFLDLERGEFVDPQFPDLMDSSPTIDAASFAFDAGLGFSARYSRYLCSDMARNQTGNDRCTF
jgi:hypothetical protein